MEVTAALEAAAGTQVDRAKFVAMWRWCMQSLAVFGAAEWFLEDVGRGRQGGAASLSCSGCWAIRGGLKSWECWTGCKEGYGIARSVWQAMVAV